MNPRKILLCQHPHKLTIDDVENLITRKDDTAKAVLADFIRHRLIDRYVTPLEHVPTDYRSGFLTMAASCLMIETFQCFRDGIENTRGKGKGKAAFKRFFSTYQAKFLGINGEEFYDKIRCGILHQAQTQGHYRIVQTGPIFDAPDKAINATTFLENLKAVVEDYVHNLRVRGMDEPPWANAIQKIEYICEAIGNT